MSGNHGRPDRFERGVPVLAQGIDEGGPPACRAIKNGEIKEIWTVEVRNWARLAGSFRTSFVPNYSWDIGP